MHFDLAVGFPCFNVGIDRSRYVDVLELEVRSEAFVDYSSTKERIFILYFTFCGHNTVFVTLFLRLGVLVSRRGPSHFWAALLVDATVSVAYDTKRQQSQGRLEIGTQYTHSRMIGIASKAFKATISLPKRKQQTW